MSCMNTFNRFLKEVFIEFRWSTRWVIRIITVPFTVSSNLFRITRSCSENREANGYTALIWIIIFKVAFVNHYYNFCLCTQTRNNKRIWIENIYYSTIILIFYGRLYIACLYILLNFIRACNVEYKLWFLKLSAFDVPCKRAKDNNYR